MILSSPSIDYCLVTIHLFVPNSCVVYMYMYLLLLSTAAGRQTECHCGAPRLRSQLEFINALVHIGSNLQILPTKDLRSEYTAKHCNPAGIK